MVVGGSDFYSILLVFFFWVRVFVLVWALGCDDMAGVMQTPYVVPFSFFHSMELLSRVYYYYKFFFAHNWVLGSLCSLYVPRILYFFHPFSLYTYCTHSIPMRNIPCLYPHQTIVPSTYLPA